MFLRTTTLLMLLGVSVFAQKPKEPETYGIKYNPQVYSKSCIKCLNNISVMPANVGYGLIRRDNMILFCMSDKDWFDQIFDSRDDGIAVDVIQKTQFPCNRTNNNYNPAKMVRGTMLEPVFLRDIKRNAISVPGMEVVVPVGYLPTELDKLDDLEFNLMIIKDDKLCRYITFYDVPAMGLALLNMELYMDTLMNNKKGETLMATSKKLEFIIPFEKSKAEYKPNDLKPVFDSLKLNYYNIKSISVRAYSSVEGTEEKNVELQRKRAESIINSLQTFQNLKINYDVSASENWVEFLSDISTTKYAPLKLLSKEEIKKELEKKAVCDDLELYLKYHRKAVLFLELEKKTSFQEMDEEKLKSHFKDAVFNHNLNTAWEIQQTIFQKVRTKAFDQKAITNIEIPESAEFGSLLINNLVFMAQGTETNDASSLIEFQRLDALIPNDPYIKWDMCVLEMRLFSQNELVIDRVKMLNNIKALEKTRIDKRLIRRLMINYNIIMAEKFLLEKKYTDVEKCLNYINLNYKNTNYKDDDLVRLAQHFVAFRKQDWALKMVEGRSNKIDVSEDLLFYYINLTVFDPKNTSKAPYRTTLLNAYNINQDRFCNLFGTAYHGGVSFQLLDDKYLKKNYCENCKKKAAE